MRKLEMREVEVAYCDFCLEEAEPPYYSLKTSDGKEILCCKKRRGLNKSEQTCVQKFYAQYPPHSFLKKIKTEK